MFHLFEKSITTNHGLRPSPLNGQMSRVELTNLDKAIQHYRETHYSVKSDNLLVRLLHLLPLYTGGEFRRYYDTIRDNFLRYAGALGLTSEQRFGTVFNKQNIYGDGMSEIVIGIADEPFNKDWIVNWRNLEPIKVLKHPWTSLRYKQIDGRQNHAPNIDYCVISIDIPKLALQYILYINYVLKNEFTNDTIPGFVGRYPLANLLRSHNEVSLFNRCDAYLRGTYADNEIVEGSFAIVDQNGTIDSVIRYQLERLLSTSMPTYQQQLLELPTLYNRNMYDVFKMPDILDIKQTRWAWDVSKMDVILFLLTLNDLRADSMKNEENYLRRVLKEIKTSNTFSVSVPQFMKKDFESKVARMDALLKIN